jgi:threonine aldolase
MIDLRSDTKTLPSPAMREAMARAEVGDDMAGEDPTVNRLEERCAALLGKEAGLFVTSGTQGNTVSMMAHTVPGQMLLCHRQSHIVIYEQGALARICGLLLNALDGPGGALDPAALEAAIPAPDLHSAVPGLVELENTHNVCGGTVQTKSQVDAVADVAHRHALPLHIDGARIFNAATALGIEARELVAQADSVQFCFSKGLGAPVGSMVVGGREFIARARRCRKILGGAMRQAGVLAAAAEVALDEGIPRLHEDHEHAQRLARTLAGLPGVDVDLETVQTNIIVFSLERHDMTAADLCARLRPHGILAGPRDSRSIRFVTHRDVSGHDTGVVCEALTSILA